MTRPIFPHLPAEGWELYLRDELAGASLRHVEEHLDGCDACRAALEAADPSRLFRRLRGLPVRDKALAGIWEGVRREIAAAPPHSAARLPQGRDRLGLLAGAATLMLSLLLLQAVRPPAEPARTALFAADPCARLALSSDECRDLFVDVRFDGEPPLVVEAAADLSELL